MIKRHPVRLLAVHEGSLAERRVVGHQHDHSLARHAGAERAVGGFELALRPAGVPDAGRQRGGLARCRHEHERRDGVVGVHVDVHPLTDHVIADAHPGAGDALPQRWKLRPADHRRQAPAHLIAKLLPGGDRVEPVRQLARRRHHLALQPLDRVGTQPGRRPVGRVVGGQVLGGADRRRLPGQGAVGLDRRDAVDCHLLLLGAGAVIRRPAWRWPGSSRRRPWS